jgi:hypothetical protein
MNNENSDRGNTMKSSRLARVDGTEENYGKWGWYECTAYEEKAQAQEHIEKKKAASAGAGYCQSCGRPLDKKRA